MGVVLLRLMPVAPFTAINLAAGRLEVPLLRYLVGTAIGMTPAVVGLVMASDRVVAALRDPSSASVALAAAIISGALLIVAVTKRLLLRRTGAGRRRKGGRMSRAVEGPSLRAMS